MNISSRVLQELKFPNGEVTSCDLNANYLLAVGLSDHSVRVLEWKAGLGFVDMFYSPLYYHKYKINSVRFSPKGIMLASSSFDGTAILLDVLKGTRIFTMVQHNKSNIKFYDFTFDCTKAITAAEDGILCFWDLHHQREIRHFHLYEKGYDLRSVTLSPDSEYLVSIDSVDLLKLWYIGDVINDEPRCILQNRDIHNDNYYCEFSPLVDISDGLFLKLKYNIVTCGADGLIKIWDLTIGRTRKIKRPIEHFKCLLIPFNVLKQHNSDVISVRFNSIGNFIASTGLDNLVKLWEVPTGKCLQTFHEHTGFVTCAAFTKNSALLATGSTNGFLIIWDLSQNLTIDSQLITPCNVSAHFTQIKLTNYCTEHERENQKQMLEFTLLQYLKSSSIVSSVRFRSKDMLAVGGSEGTIELWKRREDIQIYEIKETLKGCKYSINDIDISSCGNQIIFCSNGGIVTLWNLNMNLTYKMKSPGVNDGFKTCKFLKDSKFISAAGDDKVYLWNASTHEFIKIIQKHENAVTALASTPDSKYLVSTCSGGHIMLQSLGQEKCTFRINNAHDLGVTSCDFSSAIISEEEWTKMYFEFTKHNCTGIYLLVTCGKDGLVKLWGVGHREIFILTAFSGHGATVNYVNFFPNEPFIFASCSSDTTVRIWHARTKQCLHVFNFHKSAVTTCSFSADSTLLATGSLDKTVLIFNLTERFCLKPTELSLNNNTNLPGNWNMSSNGNCSFEMETEEEQRASKLNVSHFTKKALSFLSGKEEEKSIPHMFLCPITHEIMMDPVICSDGFIYDRAALLEWFLSRKFISPITKENLKSATFLKFSALKVNIQKFLRENEK